jgi:phosphoribosylanthranilate isomerase
MQTNPRIKICGITRLEDCLAAVQAGADALGFVFYQPSPRDISVEAAASIVQQLPPFVTKVALFVDETAANIDTVLSSVSIDCIQFHGNESNDFCVQFDKPFLKALRVKSKDLLDHQMASYPDASAFLLDAYVEGVAGGTGQTFNWDLFPEQSDKPIILAGGLTSDNVAEAIHQTHPYAVDVSGGVEAIVNGEVKKGIKDPQKIEQFIQAVRRL